MVRPSISILAEPPVAVVDKIARRKGNEQLAKAYLEYLYTDVGQEIAARHFYRPFSEAVAAKYAMQFPKTELFTVESAFGGWTKAQQTHFNEGGTFEQIQRDNR
jgi:sulfate transport system substrate-binding protein